MPLTKRSTVWSVKPGLDDDMFPESPKMTFVGEVDFGWTRLASLISLWLRNGFRDVGLSGVELGTSKVEFWGDGD